MERRERHPPRPLTLAVCWLFFSTALPLHAGEVSPVSGRDAPAFALQDLEGATQHLAEYRGQVVLVNFWASWCTPCLREMPSLQRLAESLHDAPFALLAINVAESRNRAARAVGGMGYHLPVLLDRKGDTFRHWGGKMLPTSFVLDREGKVRYRILGDAEWDNDAEIAEILQALTAEPDQPPP